MQGNRMKTVALLALAVTVIGVVRIALSFLGFKFIRRILSNLSSAAPHKSDDAVIATVGWMVDKASRRVPGASCLTQAIAAQTLLIMKGIGSTVHIGALKNVDGKFQAHAWLTCRDKAVTGGSAGSLEHYRELAKLDLETP